MKPRKNPSSAIETKIRLSMIQGSSSVGILGSQRIMPDLRERAIMMAMPTMLKGMAVRMTCQRRARELIRGSPNARAKKPMKGLS